VKRDEVKVVAQNRKARHDYHIEGTVEAGLVLRGTEVKSMRAGRVSLRDSYARIEGGEAFLFNMHIAPYNKASIENHEPKRTRKLLLNKGEIARLAGKTRERGYTLIPLRAYFRGSWAKVELALALGKRKYDKRRAIAEREAKRRMQRALRETT